MTRFKGAFQTTILGSAIRLVSGNRLLKYEDEVHFPQKYNPERISRVLTEQRSRQSEHGPPSTPPRQDSDNATLRGDDPEPNEKVTKQGEKQARYDASQRQNVEESPDAQPGRNKESREENQRNEQDNRQDVEAGQDPNLVTWYGPDDPENP